MATIEDIKSKDYTLSMNSYIEKAPIETISPKVVQRAFLLALDEVVESEKN